MREDRETLKAVKTEPGIMDKRYVSVLPYIFSASAEKFSGGRPCLNQ
jgi:hypothetical protein